MTAFVKEIIVILEEDTTAGYLTPQESLDYIRLLLHASKHIFHNYPDYHEEVLQVTKPLIKLPSVELRETREALEKAYVELADRDAEIADKDAEIARLREILFMQGKPAGK